jgi:hypothetical protein
VALEQNFAYKTFNGKGRDIGLGMPRIAKHHFLSSTDKYLEYPFFGFE